MYTFRGQLICWPAETMCTQFDMYSAFFQLFLKARRSFTCNLHPKMLLESLSVTTQNISLRISRNTYQAAPKQFLTF